MFKKRVITVALSAALLSSVPVFAQNTATESTTTTGSTSASKDSLARKDRKFIETAAVDGMAEVQLGNLAKERAASNEVKQFGQQMVDDHTKVNAELQQLAAAKGVAVPTELDRKHKNEYERLQKMAGADFDREYMKRMVSEHKKDVSDFKEVAQDGKDADVKAFAASKVPALQQHLTHAQTLEQTAKNSK